MLDWYFSKIVMSIIAVALMLLCIGFFVVHKENYDVLGLQDIADRIACSVNELNGIYADVRINMTFDPQRPGTYLQPEVGGKPYIIEIGCTMVIIRQGSSAVTSRFVYDIHLWNPYAEPEWTQEEIDTLDSENRLMEPIFSGNDFILERKSIVVDGELQYHTFIYI
jgi:hypothetical protein